MFSRILLGMATKSFPLFAFLLFCVFLAAVWAQDAFDDDDLRFEGESGVDEEEEGEPATFDFYFTCEGITDWRVAKICNYMHRTNNYIRNHPVARSPMPGSFVDESSAEGEVPIESIIAQVAVSASPQLPTPTAAAISVPTAAVGGGAALAPIPSTAAPMSTMAAAVSESPAAPAMLPAAGPHLGYDFEQPPIPPQQQQQPSNANGIGTSTSVGTTTSARTTRQRRVPFNPLDCITLQCLCKYMDESKCSPEKPLKKAVRKEYRLLSADERQKFHSALQTLKENGQFDSLVLTHQRFANESAGAHFGPAFLPWHREYNKRMEFALRMVDPDVALPFWDSTIEDAMPRPNDSMLFTDELMGTTDSDNRVVGKFQQWKIAAGKDRLKRKVGHFINDLANITEQGLGKPMSESDLDKLLAGPHVEYFLSYSAPNNGCFSLIMDMQKRFKFDLFNAIEFSHNYVHQFIGGHMGDVPLSANDPIFFLHHPFVDYIWEMFRQRHQSRAEREDTYPVDNEGCNNVYHFRESQMLPFWRMDEAQTVKVQRNVDGLGNEYTDNLYEYGPRPNCTMGPNCGSEYLFCGYSNGTRRCMAKLRAGGNCTGLENEDSCYKGRCQNGVCIALGNEEAPQLGLPPGIKPSKQVWSPVAQQQEKPSSAAGRLCVNSYACCAHWAAQGECSRNAHFMHWGCRASCAVCQPTYDPSIECSDRVPYCAVAAANGDCTKIWAFMEENCRKTCNRCGTTRAEMCSRKESKGFSPIGKPNKDYDRFSESLGAM